MGFCFFIPSKQICKSQISPPVRGFHTLIENPLDLTPDAMLQRGQPFQNFFKSVPLVNAHHKPVTWNINRLEELPFLLHCVEFNAIFVVEAVVASLVNDPLLWVLDEPMTGLDVEAVQVLKKLIQSRATFGKSVLFSSHILEICENLCDKIVIMQAGMIKKTIELRDNPSETSLEDIYMEVVNDVPMGKDFSIKQSNR